MPIFTICANRDTYLKRKILPSEQLLDTEKKLVKKGSEWQVEKYTKDVADHIKIDLAFNSGSWYIYTPHWTIRELPGVKSNTPPLTVTEDTLPLVGIQLIKQLEDIELEAYADPLTGGEPWTIGYGTTFYTDGTKVKKGDKITQQQADFELIANCKKFFLPGIQKIPYYNEMDNYQKGALLSFAYNLGAGFYGARNFETITRVLKNKEWGSMRKALVLYVNPGSNVEAGLRRRRNAEADVWFTNIKEN